MNEPSSAAYVLVHGSWHSGQCWDRVAPLLVAAGHRVFAPSLTGHGDRVHLLTREVGLDTHVDDVARLIRDEDLTEVILVGHSYAGSVISGAANEVPDRIAHLVFVDALVPVDGESAVDVMPAVFQYLIDIAAKSDVDWFIPPPPESPQGLFGITDPVDIAWVRPMLSDQTVLSWQQPVRMDNPAANSIPRTHIHCAAHPRAGERRPVPAIQPNGNPAQVWDLASGHDCMVIVPDELAELLLAVRTPHQQPEPSL